MSIWPSYTLVVRAGISRVLHAKADPSSNPISLIGKEIAGDWNAQALTNTARAFCGGYLPYDRES